jgi:hypothetical protein
VAVLAAGVTSLRLTSLTGSAPAAAAVPELRFGSMPAPSDEEAATAYERGAPSASPTSAPSASPSPTRRKPVAGLNQMQMDNAVAIVEAGRRMNLPRRAYVVAVITALQETALRNLANSRVPESLSYPHQGVYANYDSVGLFQQRSSQGWGTVAQLMDPTASAQLFYRHLMKVPGWQAMSVGDAAQAVQRSAFPDEYAKHQARAERIVAATG